MKPDQPPADFDAFESAVATLASGEGEILIAPFSDLARPQARRLRELWSTFPAASRERAVKAMVRDQHEQVERSYERTFIVALDDPSAAVRGLALEGLRISDSVDVLDLVLQRIDREPDERTRVAMVELLGDFALLAELDEIDTERAEELRQRLTDMMREDASPDARRAALEAAAFFSGDSTVQAELESAFASDDDRMRLSALRGMGRQADPRWRPSISDELSNSEPEFRFEAARAAGVSGDQAFVPALVDLVGDDDSEVQFAVIEALGSIGGTMAVRVLRRLTHAEPEAIAEAAREALDDAMVSVGQIHPAVPLARDEDEE